MRHRLPWLLGLSALALAAVFARAIQLEIREGPVFRGLATSPRAKTRALAADRGRILARDGTPLAIDRTARGLAIHYRYLEQPPDAGWLRRQARTRLSKSERRNEARIAQMQQVLRDELAALHFRLAQSCQVEPADWRWRVARVQRRVEALTALVDSRRQERFSAAQIDREAQGESAGWQLLTGLFSPPAPLAPQGVLLAEHEAFHRLIDQVPDELVQEVTRNPGQFPGVRIVEYRQRSYPGGSLASHVVGHVSAPPRVESQDPLSANANVPVVGRQGIERHYEDRLRGRRGVEARSVDHRGRLLTTQVEQTPLAGQDVILTLDPSLQAAAEQLLDRTLRRQQRARSGDRDPAIRTADQQPNNDRVGGAIVVLDVRNGDVLAAASAPRFDPNWFATGDSRVEELLADAGKPMFDRVARMAIPPGSVFKALTAVALVQQNVIEPPTPLRCQGYLDDPGRLRCQLFQQHGIGHGNVTLADAIGQSCNVYFFHHAEALGSTALLETAHRFGFAAPTGIALPEEAAGQLPDDEQLRSLELLRYLTVGQGSITATPLQIARLYAAIANGGYLVDPRLTLEQPATGPIKAGANSAGIRGHKIEGLSPATLAAVRQGLERTVADPSGTAFETVRLPTVAIAGKTGTAEAGHAHDDHAWFAGYAPCEAPRVAFVVAIEHGGSGAQVAGPIAKALVQAVQQRGYFGELPVAEQAPVMR
jgi:penicillin-binding protein 2